MRYVQWLLISSALLYACSSETNSIKTIAKGHMPAVTGDKENNIHVVYGNSDSIMYTVSTDKGLSFSTPVLVDTLTDLIDYATRGPQIAVTKNTVTIIAVNKQGNIFSYIKDIAGNWVKTTQVNDADTTNKEGFLSLSSNGDDKLFAVWPDLRADGHNKIYGAGSTDGGKTWNKNILVYASPGSTVCECCKPSVLMNANHIYVMFRNFLDGNRDLYLIESVNGGATFNEAQKLGKDSWQLDGCPMDGGALTLQSGTIQTVWRRKDSIFSAIPGATEQFIAKGKSCTAAANNNSIAYAWVNENKVIVKTANSPQRLMGNGSLPVLEWVDDQQLICVWEDNGKVNYSLVN